MFDYASKAIAGRELAKFTFSRNLSDMLEIIALWAGKLGFSREEISFIDLYDILNRTMSTLLETPKSYFAHRITENRNLFAKGSQIKLGYLIRSVRDVYIVPQHRAAPNFIGTQMARGSMIRLFPDSLCDIDLNGKIICIENADPGFDWIFTRNIGGLVTKFGGTNSHMAIRCAEYGLPAAIGVGERLFDLLIKAKAIELNPAVCAIRPLDTLEQVSIKEVEPLIR